MSSPYDTEFATAMAPVFAALATAPKIPVDDLATKRVAYDHILTDAYNRYPDTPDVTMTEHKIPTRDGTTISVYQFAKRAADKVSKSGPAMLYMHGGGFILGSVKVTFRKQIANMVNGTGVPAFAVEFRLAPENKEPVEDGYDALKWLYSHTDDFGIDPTRIAIAGDSAGGGLAAGIALLARDRSLSPPLAKQILIYPMLDDHNLKPIENIEPFALWKCEDSITGWTALLGNKAGKDDADVPEASAPARAKNLAGLPPTFMDVGTLDIFLYEDLEYASRLAAAGNSLEFHVYPGVPHNFDTFAPQVGITQRAFEYRNRAMMSF